MPIKPENAKRYPKDWKDIVQRIRQRSGGRCEFIMSNGERCLAKQGEPHPITGSIVVLTVAHLNHTPEDCRDENLLDSCQRCHNRYDLPHRRKNAEKTRRARLAAGDLFEAKA